MINSAGNSLVNLNIVSSSYLGNNINEETWNHHEEEYADQVSWVQRHHLKELFGNLQFRVGLVEIFMSFLIVEELLTVSCRIGQYLEAVQNHRSVRQREGKEETGLKNNYCLQADHFV